MNRQLTLILALLLSSFSSDASAQATKESHEAAIAAIKKLGGEVAFDEKNPSKLVRLDLRTTGVTDAGLVHLKGRAIA